MQKFDHNIGFWEKRQFVCRKLAKIAENCDHNIDPWSHWFGVLKCFCAERKKCQTCFSFEWQRKKSCTRFWLTDCFGKKASFSRKHQLRSGWEYRDEKNTKSRTKMKDVFLKCLYVTANRKGLRTYITDDHRSIQWLYIHIPVKFKILLKNVTIQVENKRRHNFCMYIFAHREFE
jgi:hypothetical protein